MCMECLQSPCHPRCPNYVAKVVGHCCCCDDEIEEGQEIFCIDGEMYCEDCVSGVDTFYEEDAEEYDGALVCCCCGDEIEDGQEFRTIYHDDAEYVCEDCVSITYAEAEDYCDW